MTVRETLSTLTNYPIPTAFIESVGMEVGVNVDDEAQYADKRALWRAYARVYYFLATAPNVSEGGVSISFSATERSLFLSNARRYAAQAGDDSIVPGASYGYKGENL